jgi:type II secretion system protein J
MKRTPNAPLPRRVTAGFTLLEVILASLVTAIISAALFGSMSVAFKARDQATAQLANEVELRSAIDAIRADLVAVPPANGLIAGPMIGVDSFMSSGADGDYLAYATTNRRTPANIQTIGTQVEQVTLFLTQDPDEPSLNLLVRSSTRNVFATVEPEPRQDILARRVVSMNFRYYDGSSWYSEWDSAEQDNALPIAIEVALVFRPEPGKGEDEWELDIMQDVSRAALISIPASTLDVTSDGGFGGFDLGF